MKADEAGAYQGMGPHQSVDRGPPHLRDTMAVHREEDPPYLKVEGGGMPQETDNHAIYPPLNAVSESAPLAMRIAELRREMEELKRIIGAKKESARPHSPVHSPKAVVKTGKLPKSKIPRRKRSRSVDHIELDAADEMHQDPPRASDRLQKKQKPNTKP